MDACRRDQEERFWIGANEAERMDENNLESTLAFGSVSQLKVIGKRMYLKENGTVDLTALFETDHEMIAELAYHNMWGGYGLKRTRAWCQAILSASTREVRIGW